MSKVLRLLLASLLVSMGCTTFPTKFATHGLIVITGFESSSQAGADLLEVEMVFKSSIPFIVPGRLLYEFITISKSTFGSLYSNFRFFELPRAGVETIQFYLCYPKKNLTNSLNYSVDSAITTSGKADLEKMELIVPAQVTELEKKTGLLIEHFKEVEILEVNTFSKKLEQEEWVCKGKITTNNKIMVDNPYKFNYYPWFFGEESKTIVNKPLNEYLSASRAATSLCFVLRRLFVHSNFYVNQAPPRWVLYFGGHGEEYKAQNDYNLKKNYDLAVPTEFLENGGKISGLSMDLFSLILSALNEGIDLRFVDISTCYGGGINLGALLRAEKTGVIPPYRFIFGSHTIVGDAEVHLFHKMCHDQFFTSLFNIDIEDPEIKWDEIVYDSFNKSEEEASKEYRKKLDDAYKKINSAYQKVYNALSDVYINLIPTLKDGLYTVNNIPCYKPIDANYFVEIPYPWLMRIGKKEIDAYKNSSIMIPDEITNLLFYTNTIPCTLKIKNIDKINAFLSAIPGDTFHIIEKLETADGAAIDASSLVEKFCKITSFKAKKLFHIKHLDKVFLKDEKGNQTLFEGAGEMAITLNKNYIEAWLFPQSGSDECYRIFMRWQCDRETGKLELSKWEPRKETEAGKEKNSFNNELEWFKKLAVLQDSYRFLKDADIEVTPWPKGLEVLNALIFAIKNDDFEGVKEAVKKGADVNAKGNYKRSVLMMATENGNLEIVKYLVEKGADVNAKIDYETALIVASEKGLTQVVMYLLGIEKILINVSGSYNGETALYKAIKNGHSDTAKVLIEKGADFDYQVLNLVVEKEDQATTQCLAKKIKTMSDQKERQKYSSDLFKEAIRKGSLEIVKILVESGFDINAQLNDGYPPLHKAVVCRAFDYESNEIIIYLLTHGASKEVENEGGETALAVAKRMENWDIINLLK